MTAPVSAWLARAIHAPRSGSRLAWLDTALIVCGVLLLLALPRDTAGADGAVRYAAMQTILDGRIPHEEFSLVTPLLALPLGALGSVFDSAEGFAYRLNGVLFALGLFTMWLVLRHRASDVLIRSFMLVLVFGSLFPPAVVSLYGETTTAVLLAVGLLAVVAGSGAIARGAGWAAVVLGVTNTPVLIPALAAVVVVTAVARRSYWPLAAFVAAVGLVLLDVRLHTGGFSSPYAGDHGYPTVLPFSGRPGFSYPAFFGVLAILFSLGKGLVFYVPGLFVPVRQALSSSPVLRRTRFLWLLVVVCMVLIYCRWWAWYGGVFFGPRFFLFASIPASLAIAARAQVIQDSLLAVAVTVGVLALSLWVGVAGAMGTGLPSICSEDSYALEHLCWYTPEFSSLWRPLIEWPALPATSIVFGLLALGVLLRLSVPLLIAAAPSGRAELQKLGRALREGEPW